MRRLLIVPCVVAAVALGACSDSDQDDANAFCADKGGVLSWDGRSSTVVCADRIAYNVKPIPGK